jgi:hypothetical protein
LAATSTGWMPKALAMIFAPSSHVNNTSFRFVDILDFKESYYGTRVVLWGLDYALVSNHGFERRLLTSSICAA